VTPAAPRGPVVVDTNVFGAGLTQRTEALAERYRPHTQGRPVFISFITVAELEYGAERARWGDQRTARLEERIGRARIVPPTRDLIRAYASFRAECARVGHALGQREHEADRWIAATALWLGLPVVAHDGVFRDAPGLTLITELDDR